MRQWDSHCDEIVELMNKYGEASRDEWRKGNRALSEELDGKCHAEMARLNDYREGPGPRSLGELLTQVVVAFWQLLEP
jgi:hypothetical protein